MRNCILLLILSILLVTLDGLARAADSEGTLRLTLPQAVVLALAANPDLTLSRSQERSAVVAVETARGRFLPDLQASGSGRENWQHQAPPGTSDEYRTVNLGLASSLNLFNGFADSAGLGSARQQLQAASATLERQRQTIAFDTASRFIAVLSDQELVQVAEQNLTSQKALQEQIDAFYRAGVRSVTDLYQQQAATALAQFNLINARRNLQVDRLQLLQTLGQNPPTTVEVVAPGAVDVGAALPNLDLAELYRQALLARPDLTAQERQLEASREAIRVARAGYLPTLALQADAGSNYNSQSHGSLSGQLGDDNLGASIGVALSVPIFDRDQTRTSVAQARLGADDAATRLAKLRQQVGAEVGQALSDYRSAEEQLTAATEQLSYARQALAATEARYRVGASTWIELSTARSTLVQAQGDEVRARYAVLLQGLNLGYAAGDLDPLLNRLNPQEHSS